MNQPFNRSPLRRPPRGRPSQPRRPLGGPFLSSALWKQLSLGPGARSQLNGALVSAAIALTWAADGQAVGTRRFELQRGVDFQGGDLQGVAIDGAGRVHAGLNLGDLAVDEAASIWSALELPDGSVLLGTGNEGKLLQLRAGRLTVAAETQALALTSLAQAWNGDVMVASMPGGQIFRYSKGQLKPFVKLEGVEHVWQLAFDPRGGRLYAATGPEGQLFAITPDGQASVAFDAEEQHLVSVAVSTTRPGWVFAGSSDEAKLYGIGDKQRVTVIHDFDRTEVRGIAENRDGEIFAIANDIKSGPRTPTKGKTPSPGHASGKGVLYRFSRDGSPEELLRSDKEHFVSLSIGSDGRPYVGTGVEGRVYTADETHHEVLMADTEERQVGVMMFRAQRPFIATSDPAVIHAVKGIGGPDAVWTSRPLDAGLRAYFGRLSWVATGPLELSTRSGNTKEPDSTWSKWSPPMTSPGRSVSPPARFVQVRARWTNDPAATLSNLSLRFVTDNLRALLTRVEVEQPDDDTVSDGDDDLKGSGGPVMDEADPTLKLTWRVDNPDNDKLRFRLQYRMVGLRDWFDVLRPSTTLTKTSFDWDTSDLPEGQYRLRVQASDELSNPPDRVKRHWLESGVFTIDNTPPSIVDLKLRAKRLRGTVVDGVGPIARIEVSLAGSDDWYPFYPRDGIFDEQREDFDLDLSLLPSSDARIVNLRVYDQANNFVVRQVVMP